MPDYRVYCLGHEGMSVEAEEIEARSDEEAILRAEGLKGFSQCEIWRGHHLVAKVTAFSAVRPPASVT